MGVTQLNRQLLYSAALPADESQFRATLDAHGLYNSFQFVLRLSPVIHRTLHGLPKGIVTNKDVGFEGAQAFSTFLHETLHWWQHVGSTYGLMASLSYPAQAHANFTHLKKILNRVGFKKPIRKLAETVRGPGGPGTVAGLANTVANNHFDFSAFRRLTYGQSAVKSVVSDPYFESVGHAYEITYGNNILMLAATVDPDFQFFQHPREWEAPFRKLRDDKKRGFYYGSPIELWPLGAREVLEGQACFIQLQYLAFASGNSLNWDDFRVLGMLHGVYVRAFEEFLNAAGLGWPPSVDHPTVALFLLVCDMAINPGAGFPHHLEFFATFISDVDPGMRFTMLSSVVRLKCPEVAEAIRDYSRLNYEEVSEKLARELLIASPLSIASTCGKWAVDSYFAGLMEEHRTFDYGAGNLPVRVFFSHFLAFMHDKFEAPEFFCWPGAWMAGKHVSDRASDLFDRHSALFIDKEDDDGIFPRLHEGRDQRLVQETFNSFYAVNLTYDMTDQWITREGPFEYDYRWLSQSGSSAEIKEFADRHFKQIYGVSPDAVELL